MRLIRQALPIILTAALAACGAAPDLDIPAVPKPPVRHEHAFVDLTSFVTHVAGAPPIDCGQYPLSRRPNADVPRDELKRSLACGLDAQQARRPFWTMFQLPGVESWMAEGLVGAADGTTFKYAYNDAPCGMVGGCPATFTIRRCQEPRVGRNEEGNLRFLCSD